MYFVWLLIYGSVMTFAKTAEPHTPWAIPLGLLLIISVTAIWLLSKGRGNFLIPRKPPQKQPLIWLLLALCLSPIIYNLLRCGFQYASLPALAGILFAAVLEEIVFRGVMIHLMFRSRPVLGVLISAVLFAAAHLLNLGSGVTADYVFPQVALAFAAGLSLGGLSALWGSLLPCMGIHILINLTAGKQPLVPAGTDYVFWFSLLLDLSGGIISLYLLNRVNYSKEGCRYETIH